MTQLMQARDAALASPERLQGDSRETPGILQGDSGRTLTLTPLTGQCGSSLAELLESRTGVCRLEARLQQLQSPLFLARRSPGTAPHRTAPRLAGAVRL